MEPKTTIHQGNSLGQSCAKGPYIEAGEDNLWYRPDYAVCLRCSERHALIVYDIALSEHKVDFKKVLITKVKCNTCGSTFRVIWNINTVIGGSFWEEVSRINNKATTISKAPAVNIAPDLFGTLLPIGPCGMLEEYNKNMVHDYNPVLPECQWAENDIFIIGPTISWGITNAMEYAVGYYSRIEKGETANVHVFTDSGGILKTPHTLWLVQQDESGVRYRAVICSSRDMYR